MTQKSGRQKFQKRRDKAREERPKWHEDLKQETKHSILAIISFALGVIFILTAFGKAGLIGGSLYNILNIIFGTGFFLIPILCFLLGISFLTSFRTRILAINLIGGALFLASSLGMIETLFGEKTGGYFGYFISFPLLKFFDIWATLILLAAFLMISILMIFNISFLLGRGGKIKSKKEQEENLADKTAAEPVFSQTEKVEEKKDETNREAGEKNKEREDKKVFES